MYNELPAENALLSPLERRRILEDIERIGLALGRQMQSNCDSQQDLPLSILESGPSPGASTPLERLALLQTLWPQVQAAVLGVLRQTDSGLHSAATSVPLERAQGRPRIANVLTRTPAGANLWHASAGGSALLADMSNQRVPEDRFQSTPETLANRFVATMLTSIRVEAEALARLSAFCGAELEGEAAQSLANDAAVLLRRAPFHDLPSLHGAAVRRFLGGGGLQRSSPPYLVLPDLWRKLAGVLRFDWSGSPLLRLPALESWHLYEIWCFIQTAATVAASGWRLAGGDAIRWRENGLRLELAAGQSSHLQFTRPDDLESPLELRYQPYFASANRISLDGGVVEFPDTRQQHSIRSTDSERKANGSSRRRSGFFGIGSRSHVMQPDIALFYRNRLLLLDAKFRNYTSPEHSRGVMHSLERSAYRYSGALQEDIDKMHTYRDALHRDGANVVEAAWSLFPGAAEGPDIYTYPDNRPETPFGTAGVGAVQLRPGQSNGAFVRLLSSWLS